MLHSVIMSRRSDERVARLNCERGVLCAWRVGKQLC